MSRIVQDAERAPCGCKWGTLDGQFVFEPCSETCDTFAYVIEQGRKRQKPIYEVSKETGSVRVAPNTCPGCGTRLDAATGTGDALVPNDGSVTVCFYCAGVFVFHSGALRVPYPGEQQSIDNDPGVKKAVDAIKELRGMK